MLKNVYENKTLFFKGPYTITFKEGIFEIFGAQPDRDEKIVIPENKQVPVMVLKQGKIEVAENYPKGVTEVNGYPIPVSWDKLVEKIVKNNLNTILILGATDSGKSTLTHYLVNRLVAQNKSVGVVDADLGQSNIGVTGTFGLVIFENKIYNMQDAKIFKSHFVGGFSPSLHCMEVLIGLKKLVATGLMNSNVVLIDTTGLIDGDNGRALKLAKIELLNPDLVVAIQKKDECEHLLKNLNNQRIFKVGLSYYVREKTTEERKLNRKAALAKALANSKSMKLSINKIKLRGCYYTTGEKLEIPENFSNIILHLEKYSKREGTLVVLKKQIDSKKKKELAEKFGKLKIFVAGQEANVLVGLLNENNDYIGSGILEKIDFARENIYLQSTVDASQIKSIVIGSVRCDLEGNEYGYFEPGIF